jgi:peptide/nickel transport system substrate-binding protein
MRCVGFLALICTLVACSRPSPTTVPGQRHAWTVPHVLRVAEISDPDHLNPYLSEMDITYDITSLIYSYLVIADDRGRLIGDLATQVPTLANGGISADGKTYVYHLRRGVLWHDGKPFTAADVVASWHAVMDPRNNTFEHEGYDRVISVAAAGPYTAVVRLRERYPPFVSRFFAPLQEGAKPVLPAHVLAREQSFNAGELSALPLGTGPFRFVSWERGDRIVLMRFDRYFKGRPKLDRIEFHFIPDDQTIAAELEAHHVDLIVAPQTSLIDTYRSVAGVTVTTAPWNSQSAVMFNAGKPILHDAAVRQAIAASVPEAEIVSDVTRGLYETPYNSLPPTAIGYERLPPHGLDLAAARRILDGAGWRVGSDGIRVRDGRRLELTLSTIAGATNFARASLLLQSSFHAAGIDLTLKTYPYSTIFAAPNGPVYSGSYDMALYSSTINWDPDIYNFTACDRWYPSGQNIFRFCDPRLDALERAGLQSDDPAVRAPIYREASRVYWAAAAYVPIYNARRLIVRSSDLTNYRPNMTSTPWWNAYDWDI